MRAAQRFGRLAARASGSKTRIFAEITNKLSPERERKRRREHRVAFKQTVLLHTTGPLTDADISQNKWKVLDTTCVLSPHRTIAANAAQTAKF